MTCLSNHNSDAQFSVFWSAKSLCEKVTIVFPESCSSYHGSSMGDDDTNRWSGTTDEGLLSQHLAESGVEIDPENEELVLNISSRLQAAVEKLLEAINETSNQVGWSNSEAFGTLCFDDFFLYFSW